MQYVLSLVQESPALPGRVASHLLHPSLVWVARNPGQTDAAALQMDEEQNVVGHQAAPSEDLDREEVDPSQHGQMRVKEFLPRRILTLRGIDQRIESSSYILHVKVRYSVKSREPARRKICHRGICPNLAKVGRPQLSHWQGS